MRKPRAIPSADAKIGRKIDYVAAAHLAPALAPHGFARQARTLWRERGEGNARALQVVNLQGYKWNEGSRGSFCVNLGVQFPALHELLAARPGHDWMRPWIGRADEAACTLRARIDEVLPDRRDAAWPPGLARGEDHWFGIGEDTDLAALGTLVAALVVEHALPWLDEAGDLAACFEGRTGRHRLAPPPSWRVAAGVLLGRTDEAAALYRTLREAIAEREPVDAVEAWLASIGLTALRVRAEPA
jgi:hypothetical protein